MPAFSKGPLLALAGLIVALIIVPGSGPGSGPGSPYSAACSPWREGTHCGAWRLVYDGYGTATGTYDSTGWRYVLEPRTPDRSDRTSAALALSDRQLDNLDVSVRLRTREQLRRPRANPWEVAWFLWHYTDDQHFYYIALKPNGWEVGKENPAHPGAQQYLATGRVPAFPVGQWFDVRVRQLGGEIDVLVNGERLAYIQDNDRPYTHGSVGLYTEDSAAEFHQVRLAPISALPQLGR